MKIKMNTIFNSEYILKKTIWYIINSYYHTVDMWWFQVDPKKIERISVWNILEYIIMYYLDIAWIKYKTDKDNPFLEDQWVDILVNNEIPLHCKWSSLKSMIWQIRNWKTIMKDLKKEWGYIVIWYVNYSLVKKISEIINLYIQRGWSFAKKEIITITEIEKYLNDIDYNKIINPKNWNNQIEIYWLVSIDDYFNNSYYIPSWENIPWTNFNQNFKEWSYFLNPKFDQYISLKELLLYYWKKKE